MTQLWNTLAFALSSLLLLSLLLSLVSHPMSFLATAHQQQQQLLLRQHLQGQMILAPLTKGGNVPFRRLCQDFGCAVSMGEMIFARNLLRGDPVEQARLRRTSKSNNNNYNNHVFGVQIATNNAQEGAAAMALAQAAGADFVDLNTGCPLYEATRRGLGSALLRNPPKLGQLVSDMQQQFESLSLSLSSATTTNQNLPLTVKIRLGCNADTLNVQQVARAVRDAGAAALTIHGRTAQQGYSKSADWEWIRQVVQDQHNNDNNNNGSSSSNAAMPIVGNGDILTYYEAKRRMEMSGVDAVMVGRGALIKPWIFQEFRDSQEWQPSVYERVSIYRRLACYMKEHFGDDEVGRKSSWRFLPWHFDFLSRYRALPEEEYGEISMDHPLIQQRLLKPEGLSPLETLLSNRNVETHGRIASFLWEADSDADAVAKLSSFAESHDFAVIVKGGEATAASLATGDTTEISNIPAKPQKQPRRRVRIPKPERTPEEIEAIRAERAAKRAATGGTQVHVDGRGRKE